MLSPRLLQVASLVKKESVVLDVGTDHAYLPIYLIQNKICPSVIASDVSLNALEFAKKNIKKYKCENIKLICTDGLNNITDNYDTLTISGMGTKTIISILKDQNLPDNLIISSNNNLYELRSFINKLGYKIKVEKAIYDHYKYYDIIAYEKGDEKLSYFKLKYGVSNNKKYYKFLCKQKWQIIKKTNLRGKCENLKDIVYLFFKAI